MLAQFHSVAYCIASFRTFMFHDVINRLLCALKRQLSGSYCKAEVMIGDVLPACIHVHAHAYAYTYSCACATPTSCRAVSGMHMSMHVRSEILHVDA